MIKWLKNNKDLLTVIIAIIALGLSVASFFRSCSTESELSKINYSISSIDYRPRVKLSNPRVSTILLSTDSIPIKETNDESDSIGELLMKIEMIVKIRATNIGNSTSKLIGYVIADTLSTEPILKQFIEEKRINSPETNNNLKFPHIYQELTPFDSCELELKYTPQWISDNIFIIHVLIFYENELEQLFDTYYWVTVKANEIVIPNPLFSNKNLDELTNMQTEIFKIIDIKDENNYSTIYSKEQKLKLIEYFNN